MVVKEPSAGSPAALSPLARAVMDSLVQGVVVFDAQGKLVYANAPARKALTLDPAPDELLRSELAVLGAQRISLKAGEVGLGEAVFFAPPPVRLGNGPATLAEQERQAILETLRGTHGKLAETARRLGISRTTLWRRLKAYGLDRDRVPGEGGTGGGWEGWRRSS